MSQIKLSLIIPMYNVENYIAECINSIQSQITEEVEVVIVDDGSTDNSKQILDEILFKLPKNESKQFKVFSQENQGQSAARNFGITQATGDYLAFVDSDDILNENYFSTILSTLKTDAPDVLRISFQRFINKPNEVIETESNLISDGIHIVDEQLLIDMFNLGAWYTFLYIFKRSLLSNESFQEGVYFEDAILVPKLLLKAKNIYFLNKLLYLYRTNNEGSLRGISPKNLEKLDKSYKNIIDVYKGNLKQQPAYGIGLVSFSLMYFLYLRKYSGINKALNQHRFFLEYSNMVNPRIVKRKGEKLYLRYGLLFIYQYYLKRILIKLVGS